MGGVKSNHNFVSKENLWKRVAARRAAMLVDGSNYYGALRSSLAKAQHQVLIVGWDIDSRTPIRGGDAPDDGAPETLGPFLAHLARHNSELDFYVLLWDYSILYGLEREPIPRLNLGWRTPANVHVSLDDHLPIGSSHHQKLVVIDDATAFCGGLDLTIRRWDTPEHRPHHDDRVDPDGAPYDPFHDVQVVVSGDAARALGELARDRWDAAEGSSLPAPDAGDESWPDGVDADLSDISVGIARTRPEFEGEPALRQVEAAYLDSIERAERFIYIENQYLTVPEIAEALQRRLQSNPDLELLIVSPRMPGGWLEKQTMGIRRDHFLKALDSQEFRSRVCVAYPWVSENGERVDVMVHSKLMIVDDRLLQVGSSNLNCRSMGADSECDLVFEARSDAHVEAITALRRRLLSEHLGVDSDELAAREADEGSLCRAIGRDGEQQRGLAEMQRFGQSDEAWAEPLSELADPEEPIDPTRYVGDLFGARKIRPMLRRAFKFLALAAAIAAILAMWRYTPLAEWADPERLGPMLEELSANPWHGPLVLGAFLLGSLIMFPVTVLIAATAIAFGPLSGFVWAFLGSMLGAAATFAVGRILDRKSLENLLGPWINKVSGRLKRRGILPIMIIRNIPIAPFTVVNYTLGASTIRFRDYLIGTALGMGPGIAAVTVLGDRIRGVWEEPSALNVSLLGLALALWAGIALGLQALSNRLEDEQ